MYTRLLKAFLYLCLISTLSLGSAWAASSHGDAEEKKERPREKDSPEEIARKAKAKAKARLDNAVNSLGTSYYIPFEQAVYYFEKMGEKAVPHLVEELKESDKKRLTSNIIYTLGRLGKNATKAVPNIIPYLKDEDPDIRAVAVIALGKIGKGAAYAVPSIQPLLSDKEDWVISSAKQALRRIGTPEARDLLAQY